VRAVVLVLLVVVLAAPAAGTGAPDVTAKLRLDGIPFRPEVARTTEQRARGLMHRSRAPKDGMLFVFRDDTTGGFWMMNTLVPLRIVFFNAEGRRVRQLRMSTCPDGDCPSYEPGRRYRFALELPVSDKRPAARLGPVGQLRELSRKAS
jgi:uncharacterized membrane protein (UPF0127 family)